MILYVVTSGTYSDYSIDKIFLSKDKAIEYLKSEHQINSENEIDISIMDNGDPRLEIYESSDNEDYSSFRFKDWFSLELICNFKLILHYHYYDKMINKYAVTLAKYAQFIIDPNKIRQNRKKESYHKDISLSEIENLINKWSDNSEYILRLKQDTIPSLNNPLIDPILYSTIPIFIESNSKERCKKIASEKITQLSQDLELHGFCITTVLKTNE